MKKNCSDVDIVNVYKRKYCKYYRKKITKTNRVLLCYFKSKIQRQKAILQSFQIDLSSVIYQFGKYWKSSGQ